MEKIKKFLTLPCDNSSDSLPYYQHFTIAASHGYDIQVNTKNNTENQFDTNSNPIQYHIEPFFYYTKSLQYAYKDLPILLEDIPGYTVEDNRYSISFHYRNVLEQYHPQFKHIIDEWLMNYNTNICTIAKSNNNERNDHTPTMVPQSNINNDDQLTNNEYPLELRPGKLVWEIRPAVEWGKGHAVTYLLENVYRNTKNSIVICIGDDYTDEDMFKAIREAETQGKITKAIPIIVHKSACNSRIDVDTTSSNTFPSSTKKNNERSNSSIDIIDNHKTASISRFTNAIAYLEDPNEVSTLINKIIEDII